ncbi:MAG: hypothetical protein E7163_03430 [Firmicutes bacterium]|nr:hypothetical protein [Bacillota bacterium]
MDGVKILQIFLILLVIGVILYLLRLYRAVKLEKRIAPFSIVSNKDNELSLFDNLYENISKIIKKLSKILIKSEILKKYALKYEKYISYENRNEKEGMDYISIKLLLGFIVIVLSFITQMFHEINIDFMFLLTIFIISFFIPDIMLNIEYSKKRKKVEEDLLKAIIIMNNAFSSGRNIIQAVETVKKELKGPIQDEFEKIYLDITYGLDLDLVFKRFYERVELEDAKYITSSLTLLNKTGGDIVKVFSMIEKSIFDKKNLKNELNSLTASSNFVFKMLVAMPFILISIIFILNPTYFNPMITTPFGIIVLVFTILLYILYILVIKKVLRVEL